MRRFMTIVKETSVNSIIFKSKLENNKLITIIKVEKGKTTNNPFMPDEKSIAEKTFIP